MTRDPVRDYILQEFLPGQDPAGLSPDQPLVSTGIIDSVGTMKLVLFLESTYAITLETEDIVAGRLDSLREIHALLAAKRAPAAQASGE